MQDQRRQMFQKGHWLKQEGNEEKVGRTNSERPWASEDSTSVQVPNEAKSRIYRTFLCRACTNVTMEHCSHVLKSRRGEVAVNLIPLVQFFPFFPFFFVTLSH